MTRAFRSHQAKNYANAYFAKLTPEEIEAQGDMKRALDAFKQFQHKFHEELNTAKNVSLYGDYADGQFSAPSEVITDDAVADISAVNAYFLHLTEPKVRVMERMAKDDTLYQAALKGFAERLEELIAETPTDPSAAFSKLFDEVIAKYKKAEKGSSET